MVHNAYQAIKQTLPTEAGVYRYYNTKNEVIYVGKAKNLKKRVASYFTKKHDNYKTSVLVKQIVKIEYTVVETEQDALLLENTLIKKFQPRYNVNLKDDKSYPYICIKNERFPRVFLTRKLVKDGSEYLGPLTSVKRVRYLLNFLRKMYPLRTCNFNLSKKNIENEKFKTCLEYHLGNCKAPCTNLQTEEDYAASIKQIKHILNGNYAPVKKILKAKMEIAAKNLEFEQAAYYKGRLELLNNYQSKNTVVNPKIHNVNVFAFIQDDKNAYVSFFNVANGSIIQVKLVEITKKLDESKEVLLQLAITNILKAITNNATEFIIPFTINYPDENIKLTIPKIGDKKKLLDLATKNAVYYKKQKDSQKSEKKASQKTFEILSQIKSDFRLTELPSHIECFDNSNLQGTNPVASMVVFRDAKPYKKDYRHYKIKTVEGPDDFASMTEVVGRRYKRLLDEGLSLPQLIVIDGGKGQLSAAVKALKELEIYGQIAIIGIAKQLEEIFVPGDSVPLYIDKNSYSLRVIQQLRNEAHRFAITFHRKLRSKNTFKSELEQINGIGKTTAHKLLSHFKSIEVIKQKSITELHLIIDLKKAKAVYNYFNKKRELD